MDGRGLSNAVGVISVLCAKAVELTEQECPGRLRGSAAQWGMFAPGPVR